MLFKILAVGLLVLVVYTFYKCVTVKDNDIGNQWHKCILTFESGK